MKKIIYMLMMSMGLYTAASAQVKIGKNPTTIDANANLSIQATDDTKFHVNKDNGRVGIGTNTPANNIEITQGTAGNSGLRFTNLTNAAALATNTNGDVIVATAVPANGAFWGLTGNSGTVANTNFLGTTDSKPLMFRVNGNHAGKLSNVAGGPMFFGVGAGNTSTTASENSAFGNYALNAVSTGSDNSAFGSYALSSNTTGIRNVAVGSGAMSLGSNSNNNAAVGYESLRSTTGSANAALGFWSLYSNTEGSSNTATGAMALYSNTAGSYNTAVGASSLLNVSTGNNNTAVGSSALNNNASGNNNIGIGYQANYHNTTGSNNVAVGNSSIDGIGSNNTALGHEAGKYLANVSNSTFIGYQAGYASQITGNHNMAIGAQAEIQDPLLSNQMSIANIIYGTGIDGTGQTISTGNIGIGTNAPTEKLHVNGNILATGTVTPDYVFEEYVNGVSTLKPEYKRLSLREVDAFVKENKHLPGVPSSKEVQDKGGIVINRATEINLEKIEELYLHVIELNKKIEAQQKEIDNLKANQK